MSGQVTGPPSAATRPMSTWGSARWALSAMNTMSDRATRLQPRPTAGPLTAATMGTRHPTMPVTIWRPWASVSFRQTAVLGQLVEVGEVAAGRECLPVPGQHHGPGLVVGIDLGEEPGQAPVELVVGGVELLGPVQPDHPHRPVDRGPPARRVRRRRSWGGAPTPVPAAILCPGIHLAPADVLVHVDSSRVAGHLTIASIFSNRTDVSAPWGGTAGRGSEPQARRGRAHEAGSPRMRRATRFRWIWEVPPMTLWARLYR